MRRAGSAGTVTTKGTAATTATAVITAIVTVVVVVVKMKNEQASRKASVVCFPGCSFVPRQCLGVIGGFNSSGESRVYKFTLGVSLEKRALTQSQSMGCDGRKSSDAM